MSAVSEAFVGAFGAPDPAAPNGVHLGPVQAIWDSLHKKVGSGWFRGGFLYLFGEGLGAFGPCLEAWSFLVPPCADRRIIGRNAYGALLVLDNVSTPPEERVKLLDPFTVTFTEIPNTRFVSLIGRALPKAEVPVFLEDRAYLDWRKENNVDRLDLDDVLGIKAPKALGGELVPANLQLDGMVDYYQTTAPIYAKAFAKLKAKER
jgi:hypothetical protein